MTKLLISVRDAQEARVAYAAGADIIDVKEPRLGSLGRADPAAIRAVLAAVGGGRPVSAALGELLESAPFPDTLPPELSFVKIGLAGCAHQANWLSAWKARWHSLAVAAARVAVVYVDWGNAHAPDPVEVIAEAAGAGCACVLFDTFQKHSGNLFSHTPAAQLKRWCLQAAREGLMTVMGGSLGPDTLPLALALEPDYIAVRAAACEGGRLGAVSRLRVQQLRLALDSPGNSFTGQPLG